MFNWLFPKTKVKLLEQPMWEYSEKPVIDYEAEHRETMAICEDILIKLDEIRALIDEMKNEDKKDV